jgi:hypothetical protein
MLDLPEQDLSGIYEDPLGGNRVAAGISEAVPVLGNPEAGGCPVVKALE